MPEVYSYYLSAQLYRPVFDALEWNVCEEPPPTTADLKDRFIFISSDDNCSALERASRIQVVTLLIHHQSMELPPT